MFDTLGSRFLSKITDDSQANKWISIYVPGLRKDKDRGTAGTKEDLDPIEWFGLKRIIKCALSLAQQATET